MIAFGQFLFSLVPRLNKMRPIKTQQRYRCDFCKKTGIKSAIERHEKICFRNPGRFCDYCGNEGVTTEFDENTNTNYLLDCPYCASFNKKQLEEIEAREKKEKKESNNKEVPIKEVPF